MNITATIFNVDLDSSQIVVSGAWASATATVTIDPQDGDEPIVLEVESGGWLGYGAAIPESLHGSARAAGSLGGYGSLSDWQIALSDDHQWHAGRAGADAVLDALTEEQYDRLALDDDALREAISDAIMEADVDLGDSEQVWLRRIVVNAVPRRYRPELENALDDVELPGGDIDCAETDEDDVVRATENYLVEMRAVLAKQLKEPVGEVEYADSIPYIACIFGAEGDQPGLCESRWGEDLLGLWWADDGDDNVRADRSGPFVTSREAEEQASEYADDGREPGTEEDEDIDAYLVRVAAEAEGRATSDGQWVVLWSESGAGRSYDDKADAELEIAEWYRGVLEHTPNALTHLMDHPSLGERVDGDVRAADEEVA